MEDLSKATVYTEEVEKTLKDQYDYHPWDTDKTVRGTAVREALQRAAAVIIDNVPPSPDRSVALRKLREARMDCNSAITHNGKY